MLFEEVGMADEEEVEVVVEEKKNLEGNILQVLHKRWICVFCLTI